MHNTGHSPVDLSTATTRVVALDDHPLMRRGIRCQLERDERIELVGEGATNADLLPLVEAHAPDVVLLDLIMPEVVGEAVHLDNGFRLLRTLKALHAKQPQVKVILLTGVLDYNFLDEATRARVSGYLLKDDDLTDNLPNAVRHVHAGGTVLSERVRKLQRTERPDDLLTPREREVLLSFIRSPRASPDERAEQLGVRKATLKKHLNNVYRKLDVFDANGAVVVGLKRGLVPASARRAD